MVRDEWKKTDGRLAARCAAVTSLGAGLIHLVVAPVHWRDWVFSGLFFVAIALFQLVWAFLAWSRPTALVLGAGVAVNAAALALWVTSRTGGVPFGPFAGQPEAVDAAGICVLLLECYVVMGAGWAWIRGYRAEQVSGFNRAAVLLAANAVMVGAVAVGVGSTLQGHAHDHHEGATEAQGGHPATPEHPAPQPVEEGLPVTDMSLDADAVSPTTTPAPAENGQHHR